MNLRSLLEIHKKTPLVFSVTIPNKYFIHLKIFHSKKYQNISLFKKFQTPLKPPGMS
jgi:hypothetical protein